METKERVYNIKIDNFESPFELLDYLLKENKYSIFDIPIAEITDQYVEYLFSMQSLNMEIASEFIVMAATLLYIKSRSVLPKPKLEVEEEEEDPEKALLKALLEYKRAKKLSEILMESHEVWSHAYYKGKEFIDPEPLVEPFRFSPYHLSVRYANTLISKADATRVIPEKMKQILEIEKVSVGSRIRDILKVMQKKAKTTFNSMFADGKATRVEIITSFLAILELSKRKRVSIDQKKQFDDIFIKKLENEEEK